MGAGNPANGCHFVGRAYPGHRVEGEAGGVEAGAACGTGYERLLATAAHGALRPVHVRIIRVDGRAELLP